jgi:hypothetical protein
MKLKKIRNDLGKYRMEMEWYRDGNKLEMITKPK